MTEARTWEQNTEDDDIHVQSASPRIVRALQQHMATFSDLTPVDTLNPSTTPSAHLPTVQRKGAKKQTVQLKSGCSVSLHLRSLFGALLEFHHTHQPLSLLSFVTVNLSAGESKRIAATGGATAYGKKLARRFKSGLPKSGLYLHQVPTFFVVLEDSADGSLHAHILMRHHPDDQYILNQMLRKEAAPHDNAVMFQTEYKLWLNAEPGSTAWQLNELDLETGCTTWQLSESDVVTIQSLCTYPELGQNRHGQTRYFRRMAVDAGAADYISKELENAIEGFPQASRLYADRALKRRADELYGERYTVKRETKAMLAQQPDETTTVAATSQEHPAPITAPAQPDTISGSEHTRNGPGKPQDGQTGSGTAGTSYKLKNGATDRWAAQLEQAARQMRKKEPPLFTAEDRAAIDQGLSRKNSNNRQVPKI